MREHVYYHRWTEDDPSPLPYQNLRCPIVLSIATLRGVNPNIPITVLNKSEREEDWGCFPEKLNFEVINDPCLSCEQYKDTVKGYRHLSRFPDLIKRTRDTDQRVIYVDTDVFWFRDPLPLAVESEKLCIDGWNTGFFYYDSQHCDTWADVLETYIKASVYSPELHQVIKQYVGYDEWYGIFDEQILTYMKETNPELIEIIPIQEHITGSRLTKLDPDTVKMIHFNGIMMLDRFSEEKHARGLAPLVIKEFYENMMKVLSQDDLVQIYSQEMLTFYEKYRFPLLPNLERLLKTKRDQHYHLDKCWPLSII